MNLLGFVPAIVVQHLIDNKLKNIQPKVPERQTFKSVVMFADISGFTNLTEQLSRIGPEGSEVIAFAINRYMELLVKSIGRSGGDIFKFAGDAMIVVWPPPSDQESLTGLKILLRQGIQSALDIQQKLSDTFILEDIKLSVKIGFGVGDIDIVYVGGVFNRSEYLATGDPLIQAFESEHCATEGGQTIISQQVYELIGEHFNCIKIPEHHNYFVNGYKGQKVQNISNALMITNKITTQQLQLVRADLQRFVPAAVLQFILVDQEKWSSELRRLSIVFVNLGIDLSMAQKNLQSIQKVIETVQKCVYSYQGSLNKLLMDDKGSTLIVVFGLPPVSQQDDPTRAILTSQAMQEELSKINCKCRIGIATGFVFAGVVGTSGSRREYSVIGDSVNLAARLMQAACLDENEHIIVDEQTAKEASYKLNIQAYKVIQVKGKTVDIPIYVPRLPLQGLNNHNPYYPIKDTSYVDRSDIENKIQVSIQSFIQSNHKSFLYMKGQLGAGKSLLLQNSIKLIQKNNQKSKYVMLSTSIDSFTLQFPYCGLKQITQQLLHLICQRMQLDYSLETLKQIVIKENEASQIFYELFDFQEKSKITLFQKRADDEQNIINKLKTLLFSLFKFYQNSQPQQSLIVIIDDAQNLEKNSILLIRHIMKHINNIMLILSFRDIYFEQSQSYDKQLGQIELINDGIRHISSTLDEEYVTEVKVQGLTQGQLYILLQKQFKIFTIQFEDQSYRDQHGRSKSIYEYHNNKSLMMNEDPMTIFISYMYSKTQGIPLTFIQMIQIFIRDQLIITKSNQAYITSQLLDMIILEEQITVEQPLSSLRINGPILDKISCIEQLVLKIASVIGNIFDIQTLDKILPFKEAVPSEKLVKILDDLENENIIEVMEKNELNKYYRFTHSFMREGIYQRLTYTYRRDFHKLVAQCLQEIPQQFPQNEQLEALRLKFHWTLAEQKWTLNKNKMVLSHNAKRSIIIQQIQSKIRLNDLQVIIISGVLEKKSERNVTWASRFCVMTQKEFRYYYHEQDYLINQDSYLGRISLSNIYSVLPLNEKEKGNKLYAFELRVSQWIKRQKFQPRREFYFAALNENQMEEWTIFFEFIRAKAIYDEFVNNFGKIQFPLPSYKDSYNMKLAFNLNKNSLQQQRNIKLRQKRQTIISVNKVNKSISEDNFSIGSMDKTKDRVKALFNNGLLLLFSHIFESSLNKQDFKLGSNTKAMRRFIHKFRIDQSLIDGNSPEMNKSRKRLSEINSQTFAKSRQSLQVNLTEIREEEPRLKEKEKTPKQSIVRSQKYEFQEEDFPVPQNVRKNQKLSSSKISTPQQISVEIQDQMQDTTYDNLITNTKFQSKANSIRKELQNQYMVCIKNTQSLSLPKCFLQKGQRVQLIGSSRQSETQILLNGQISTFSSLDFIHE